MVLPFGCQLPLCFNRVMVALVMHIKSWQKLNNIKAKVASFKRITFAASIIN